MTDTLSPEVPEGTRCRWFALCANLATYNAAHPILGVVPCCDAHGEALGGSPPPA